jgi:hypothetical protein
MSRSSVKSYNKIALRVLHAMKGIKRLVHKQFPTTSPTLDSIMKRVEVPTTRLLQCSVLKQGTAHGSNRFRVHGVHICPSLLYTR